MIANNVICSNVRRRGGSGELVPHWYDGVSQGNISDAAAWQEISGMACPKLSVNSGYLWAISDASANQLAAMTVAGAASGVLTLTGSTAKVDVEKVSSRTVNGVNYIYFFDMGNNGNGANSRGAGIDLRIFRMVEPTITGSNLSTTNYIEINCAFPVVGAPTLRDMEAAFVDEFGTIFMITKRDAAQHVYSLAHQDIYTGTQTLVYEGDMTPLPAATTVPLTTTPCYAVSACMRDDGKEILVKNYSNVYVFQRNPLTQTVFQALSQALVVVPAYVGGSSVTPKTSHPSQEPQGEAMCYAFNQSDFFTCSEFLATEGSTTTRFPLFKYIRATKVPTTTQFQDGVYPSPEYALTQDTYIWSDTNPTVNYGTEASFVCDNPFDADSRVGLLKFNLSAIPQNAIVIGAHLFMNIANEGQGVYLHRIIGHDWDEATATWDSVAPALDDVFAVSTPEVITGINLDAVASGIMQFNVSVDTVQAMVSSPSTNFGWIVPGIHATDGMQFDSHRGATPSLRPRLAVRWYLP